MGFIRIYTILKKEIKQIARSKLTLTVIILGPILIIVVAGLTFSGNNLHGVNVEVTFPGNYENEFTTNLISSLREEGLRAYEFETTSMEEAKYLCEDFLKHGGDYACLVIQRKNESIIGEYDSRARYMIETYVDYSRTKIVKEVIQKIQSAIAKESADIMRSSIKSASGRISNIFGSIETQVNEINKTLEKLDFIENAIVNQVELNSEIRKSLDETYESINDLQREIEDIPSNYTNSIDMGLFDDIKEKIMAIKELIRDDELLEVLKILPEIRGKLMRLNTELETLKEESSYLQKTLSQEVTEPIPVRYTGIKTGESRRIKLNSFDYALPELLLISLMFSSILLGSILILSEKKSKAFFRNIFSPMSQTEFIAALFIAAFIIMIFQETLLILISKILFKSNLYLFNFSFQLLTLSLALFILIGIVIGSVANSEENTILIAITVGILFLITSNMVIPTEFLPYSIKPIISYLPIPLIENILNRAMLFNTQPYTIRTNMMLFSAYILVASILAVLFQNKMKQKQIN